MQKYNVGIIGATADIANAHIDAIDFLDDFILTAVCDLGLIVGLMYYKQQIIKFL